MDENFETALNYVTFPLNDLDARITDYIILLNKNVKLMHAFTYV